LLLNTLTGGGSWTENGVDEGQVYERYGPTISRGAPALWDEAAVRVKSYFEEVQAGREVPPET
jgi:putative hydrolase of HD superfamily